MRNRIQQILAMTERRRAMRAHYHQTRRVCDTLKCENVSIFEKVVKCENISTLNVTIYAICEK